VASLSEVFLVINRMRAERVVNQYAIGGATAVLFYAEPTRTYDVDVFVLLPADERSQLVSLTSVYRWAEAQGFTVESEHMLIHGVPVQVLPAYNELVIDAIHSAREHDYDGTLVRVVDPEHLVALALQAGGPRRRERAWFMLQSGTVDRARLRTILDLHRIPAEIPDES
jgi:hypothetical protein